MRQEAVGEMKKVGLVIAILIVTAQSIAPGGALSAGAAGGTEGIASWYGFCSPGVLKTTASMEAFDENALTCATWNFPFNDYLRITNLENGKSVVVRVNDRGPARRLVGKGRIIDLTKEAFSRIADLDRGLIRTRIERISVDEMRRNRP